MRNLFVVINKSSIFDPVKDNKYVALLKRKE